MKYLVTATGGPGFSSPEEAIEVLKSIILPSFDALIKFEKEGRIIAGGLPVGDRAFVLIVEADSNDDLDRMLRGIPMWGSLDWEVTPLQSIEVRAAMEREAVK